MQIYLPIAELSVNIFLFLGMGACVGFLSGLFGVGGGFLMTPLLLFAGIPAAVAVATEANQIVASSVSGALAHWRRGNVDIKMGVVLLLGGFIGSTLGVWVFGQKYYNWDLLRQLVEAETALPEAERSPMEQLVSRSMTYNHQLRDYDNTDWHPDHRDGFISIPAGGQGLTLLSRKVPETMVERGVVTNYPDMSLIPAHADMEYYDFFGHLPTPSGRLFLHEDQSFSLRWVRGCGGTIWLDYQTEIRHAGLHTFDGRYSDKLQDDFPSLEV